MNYLSNITLEFQCFFVALFGLIVGSFISLFSHRIVSKEPIFFARSKCLNCNKQLAIKSLIPLFSWIIQKGKCIFCHAKISCRYPLIEFFCAIGFVATFLIMGNKFDAKYFIYIAIYSVMLTMIIVDLEHYFIPNILQYILAFLVTLLIFNAGGVISFYNVLKSALAYVGFGLAIWIFFYYSAGIDGIGIDDFKFFLIAGFMLGIDNLILFMLLSGVLGAVFGSLWQKIKKDETFPFAPAICISAYLCLIIGKPIIY